MQSATRFPVNMVKKLKIYWLLLYFFSPNYFYDSEVDKGRLLFHIKRLFNKEITIFIFLI